MPDDEMEKAILSPQFVTCLAVDLIGSTALGLSRTSRELDRFNTAFIGQIENHLSALQLETCPRKFTGDGWLIFSSAPQEISSLCCLALVLAHRFQAEMAGATSIPMERVPPLRIALCSGRDVAVALPRTDEVDFVGDSARRAVRSLQHCAPNEILFDEPVRLQTFRDFVIEPYIKSSEPFKGRQEEDISLFRLISVNPAAAQDDASSERFIYTLGQISGPLHAAAVSLEVQNPSRPSSIPLKARQLAVTRAWNHLIASTKRYDRALSLFEAMRTSGISPDAYTFTSLIARAPNFSEAQAWFAKLDSHKVQPTQATFTALLARAPDYEAALQCFRDMSDSGFLPNVFTYSSLISKSSSYSVAMVWYDQLLSDGLVPDVVIYTNMIDRSPDLQTATYWMQKLAGGGWSPDCTAYSALMKKAGDFQGAVAILDDMLKAGVAPSVVTYSTLINKAPTFEVAADWFSRVRARGVKPDLVAYTTMITKAPDYQEARKWFDEVRAVGLEPDPVTYGALLLKAPDLETAIDLVKSLKSWGHDPERWLYGVLLRREKGNQVPDEFTEMMQAAAVGTSRGAYIAAINFAPNFESGVEIAEEMRSRGMSVPSRVLTNLLAKASDYRQGRSCIDLMIDLGTRPRAVHVSMLAGRCRRPEEVRDIVDMLQRYEIELDLIAYTSLIRTAPDYDTAKGWYRELRRFGHKPDVVAYTAIMFKASSYEEARKYLSLMQREGIRPNRVTYTVLVNLAPDFDTAVSCIEEMAAGQTVPDEILYTSLIAKAPTYDAAVAIFDKMQSVLTADVVSFTALMSKAPDQETARHWLNVATRRNVKLDAAIWHAVLRKAVDYEAGRQIVEDMRRHNVLPSRQTFDYLLALAPDFSTARAICEEMKVHGLNAGAVGLTHLAGKDLSEVPGERFLEWFLQQPFKAEQAVDTAIAQYRRIRRIPDALRLALDYPHVSAARKLFRLRSEESIEYLAAMDHYYPAHSNAAYALGIAHMEIADHASARQCFRRALAMTSPGSRANAISGWLQIL